MPKVQLVELQAMGLGPIDDARVEFGPGFNVLTGETGAGKTLLVGALSLALGNSDGRGLARQGSLRAVAVFQSDSAETALARESISGGRLRGSIDGLATSAEGLRARANELIVIHGQHDSLRLRERSEVLRLIDDFGQISDQPLRDVRREARELDSRRESFGGDPLAREREVDFLKFQLSDIDAVAPTSSTELADSLDLLRELSSLRDHREDLLSVVEVFDGDQDDAILSRWSRAAATIPPGGRFDEIRDRLTQIATDARELVHDLGVLVGDIELNPAEIDRLEQRVAVLQNLVRKYGGSLEQVLSRRAELMKEIAAHEEHSVEMAEIDALLSQCRAREEKMAAELLAARTKAAEDFIAAVNEQFVRVALANASLSIEIGASDGSAVDLKFAPNPGHSSGPLQSMASGGELSRVLLAISLVTVTDDIVAVFDEIDAGVGGSVAQQIGECLAELATRQQVILVTHLASIAALADRHFVVSKEQSTDATSTLVREVVGEDRVSEISRMLAGESDLSESRALAERLLAGR